MDREAGVVVPSPAETEYLHRDASPQNIGLFRACFITGVYGVAIGAMLTPMGLFVGPHMLVAAVGHIAAGVGFLVSAEGLKRGRIWAAYSASLLSLLAAVFGTTAVIESFLSTDTASLIFWVPFSSWFLVLFTGTLAAVPWIKWRFNLRTMLIGITIVALVLGAFAMA